MSTHSRNEVAAEIDRTLELSSVCRNEWCRELESEVDTLSEEWNKINGNSSLNVGKPRDEESRKIRAAYRNLGPDVHV